MSKYLTKKTVKGFYMTKFTTTLKNMLASQKNKVKKAIKLLLPPIIILIIRNLTMKNGIIFVSQPSWERAEQASEGYDADEVIEKVRKSAKLVYEGKAEYERDSVIFEHIHYSYPALAALIFVACNRNSLRVIDFGGALGTTYQQNRKYLSKLRFNCEWRIVEQERFVEIGKKEFTNNILSFYGSIEEALKDGIDVVIFSNSICYVSDPYSYMENSIKIKAPYVIFDKTPVINGNQDTFAVQYVPESIYKASYPIRNFAHKNILKKFEKDYELIEEWICDIQANSEIVSKGFLFKRI